MIIKITLTFIEINVHFLKDVRVKLMQIINFEFSYFK